MVAPSWGSFQKPDQSMQLSEEKEFDQESLGEIKDQEKPQGEKPQWGNFQSPTTYQGPVDPTEDEGLFEWGLRNATANISRLGEQIAGRYGNIEKFAKDALVNFPKHAGGPVGWAISELVGPERWEKLIRGDGRQNFPTSEQFKEASQAATKGYTKPKTSGEAKFQEFTEDVGATLQGRRAPNVPGRNATTQAAINHLLIPGAANLTKEIVKEVGFGEDKANMAKLAVWIPLTLANNINAPRYASDLMNQGRNGVPTNAQFNTQRFLNRLDGVERTLLTSDPRTALARQQITQLRNDVAGGQTSVRDAMNMFDGTNAVKRSRGMFELGRTDQNFARRSIDQVKNAVRDEIVDSAQNFPEALNNWRNGVQSWAVIHQSNAMTNWIKDAAKGPYAKILSAPAAGLFGIGSYGAYKAPIVGLTGSAALPAAYKTGQILYRVQQNPTLRNYYWNALNAANQQNMPVFFSNYQKLNNGIEKSIVADKKSEPKK